MNNFLEFFKQQTAEEENSISECEFDESSNSMFLPANRKIENFKLGSARFYL